MSEHKDTQTYVPPQMSTSSQTSNRVGELTLIWGPMFASKSSTLISYLELYSCVGIEVLAINHVSDNRYSSEHLCTHNGKSFPSIRAESLYDVMKHPQYKRAKCICIDEAQFFPSLYTNVMKMVEKDNKIVYVAGLSGTYERKLFGELHKLVPMADHIVTLHAVCADCKDGRTPGIFTKRIIRQDEFSIEIGSRELYKPVCRRHYLE